MSDNRIYALDPQLDINHILLEAHHRWLRTAEICEIIQNHEKFRIAPEPQNIPPSGSLFLFDRKAVRYFRKDGHSWRKKKDGKTVKEAHERLKVGRVDVLHCYYAHGEDNENFQRRSYWMLEEGLSHIVLVHYLEVQGNRTCNRTRATNSAPNNSRKNGDNRTIDTNSAPNNSRKNGDMSRSDTHGSVASRFQQHDHLGASQVTDTTRLNSSPTSEYEDVESVYRHQASPEFRSFQEMHSPNVQHTDAGLDNYQGQLPATPCMFRKQQELETHSGDLKEWQGSGSDSLHVLEWPSIDQKPGGDLKLEQNTYYSSLAQPLSKDLTTKLNGTKEVELCDSLGLPNTVETSHKPESTGNLNVEDKSNYPSLRQPLLDGAMGEGLKKLDIFGRWMSKELNDVIEPTLQSGSGEYWDTNQMALDNYILSPSLSQDQLFSITDFSPNWAFSGSEIKVLISGRFLRNQKDVENHRWACMFGEVEVPAQIVGDGILQCNTPSHKTGRVPFYITCSNRLACSEVREFEFQESSVQDAGLIDFGSFNSDENLLHMRFEKMLSLTNQTSSIQSSSAETSQLCFRISALLEDNTEWEQMLNLTKQDEFFSADEVKGQLQQKLLKEKLQAWLIQKVGEGENGPCVFDEGGQGVLHFAAALGYDWCILPTLAAGVGMNFRDANGWTALHWAAYYGRERTVGFLISHGAAPGLVTDPTPVYTSGRTPSDLAAGNGHKGIAGYLAECSLSFQLSSLDLNDSNSHDNREKAVKTVSDSGDLTLNGSLAAVRNATQAAARIHQVFRYQSFQRKQVEEYGGSEFGFSGEHTLSLIAGKSKEEQHYDPVHAAATCIQNKYRSRKSRQQFLLIRKHVIKIQAHVRGHQVRKNYTKIVRSVWFIDRVVLRWRRKRRGLSWPKPETDSGSSMIDNEVKEDEYEYLKAGRKQTEERLQKELARVKSMVKYPDAQGQYHRLLNVVSEMQETKAMSDEVMNSLEADFGDLTDFESLWDDDDAFMPTAS